MKFFSFVVMGLVAASVNAEVDEDLLECSKGCILQFDPELSRESECGEIGDDCIECARAGCFFNGGGFCVPECEEEGTCSETPDECPGSNLSPLDSFEEFSMQRIKGNDEAVMEVGSPEECASMCLADPEGSCRSIEFNSASKECVLSSANVDDSGVELEAASGDWKTYNKEELMSDFVIVGSCAGFGYWPVCGFNGLTYSNSCRANLAGVGYTWGACVAVATVWVRPVVWVRPLFLWDADSAPATLDECLRSCVPCPQGVDFSVKNGKKGGHCLTQKGDDKLGVAKCADQPEQNVVLKHAYSSESIVEGVTMAYRLEMGDHCIGSKGEPTTCDGNDSLWAINPTKHAKGSLKQLRSWAGRNTPTGKCLNATPKGLNVVNCSDKRKPTQLWDIDANL